MMPRVNEGPISSPPSFHEVRKPAYIKNTHILEQAQSITEEVQMFDYNNDNRVDKINEVDSTNYSGFGLQ